MREKLEWFRDSFDRLAANVETVIRGKPDVVRLTVLALIAEGHVLLEDVPGTGKTSLAKAIAGSMTGTWHRIQFTPDLLPSDVTGVTIFNQGTRSFEFHPGPVFSNILVADEINRASPKTQAALLEVMDEHQVTVDGVAHVVERPFVVIATQNSIEFEGTYRLPEAQLDRFLLKTTLGYPSPDAEIDVLESRGAATTLKGLKPIATPDGIRNLSEIAENVHVQRSVQDYLIQIATVSRSHPEVRVGISTRGCLAMQRAARVMAASRGEEFVTPDHVKQLAVPLFAHRMVLTSDAEVRSVQAGDIIRQIIDSTEVPLERARRGR